MLVSLVTLGDPSKQTGGYLYHRRLAEAAPQHGAQLTFVSVPERAFPLPAFSGSRVMAEASTADVIVIDSIALAFLALSLRSVKTPVVGMLHQGPGGIDHGRARTIVQAWLDRRAYRHMRALLVASESLAKQLRRYHHDIRVVPPGRNVSEVSQSSAIDLRRARQVAFLCVANWLPQKGITELLDAFQSLPESAGTLHLVGADSENPRYAARIRKKAVALGDRVVVHGYASPEEVARLYQGADVFVLPSLKETYGTVYGEAMAAGLPVVGWRAGNLPYLARHETEGLIIDPGDVAGLADALRRLAEDRQLRESMGEAARVRASSFPTWEETSKMFFEELRNLRA